MNEEYKKSIKEDIKKYSAIDAIKSSKGGQVLIESLQKDIVATVDNIAANYQSLTHIELIALSARLSEKLTILRVLDRSKSNKKLALEALKEAEKEDNTD